MIYMKLSWHPIYYRCYTYRPPATGLVGFSSILYVNNFPDIQVNTTSLHLGIPMVSGIRLLVHPHNTLPLVTMQGINVSPGNEVIIKLDQTKVNRLSAPYGKCTDQSLLDALDETSYRYSQAGCLGVCRQQQYIDNCSCAVTDEAFTDRQLKHVNYTFCMSQLHIGDKRYTLEKPICRNNLSPTNEYCDCRRLCHTNQYDTTVSISSWPNPANQLAFYEKYIKPHPELYGDKFDEYGDILEDMTNVTIDKTLDRIDSVGLIRNNFLQLTVQMKGQSVRYNDDIPAITWDTLFSNIGGVLNLWLGITILVIAEIVELMFHILTLYLNKMTDYIEDAAEEHHVHHTDVHMAGIAAMIAPVAAGQLASLTQLSNLSKEINKDAQEEMNKVEESVVVIDDANNDVNEITDNAVNAK